MQESTQAIEPRPSLDDFAAMLDETLGSNNRLEGSVVRGTVVGIDDDIVIVDVGLKSEGRVPLKEFGGPGQQPEVRVGDTVEVFVERFENRGGEVVLSRDKARREESWNRLERAFNDTSKVEGHIFGRVKGGFAVDLGGAVAFLPGSQVDIRPVRDIGPLINKHEPFLILKMDRRRGNIVVSRRAVLEESRAEQRNELLATLSEGQILDGVVKNITDYGAFVDLGGLDGLLHVTDISWKRVNHPSDVLGVGQNVRVQVIRFNRETQRISLGMKQLEADPVGGRRARSTRSGAKFTGRVTNITDYGAFVELEAGVEGLVHVSEMSWTKKNTHPGKIVSSSQEVEVMVLEVDPEKRRISLGLKQCLGNPWEAFVEQSPGGLAIIEGEIRNITEFGLFVGLDHDIDGMVHLSDLDWSLTGEEAVKKYAKGDVVRAQVLDVDVEKERISLGIKQLGEDPFKQATCRDQEGRPRHLHGQGGQCRRHRGRDHLGRHRVHPQGRARPRSRRAAPRALRTGREDRRQGDDASTAMSRRLGLSVKALEIEDEKQAMAEFGSSDSGASLGDILGAAFRQKQEEQTKN